MADNDHDFPMHILQQQYPHIPVERLKELQNIEATEQQLSKINGACKQHIDKRLKAYNLNKTSDLYHIEAEKSRRHLRVAVIGASGSGKSSSGNTLLKAPRFVTSSSATSQTTRFQTAQVDVKDTLLHTVIDTPGSWIIPKEEEHVDLYVFVINLASPRFRKGDLENIRQLKDYNKILENKRCILLLTHASDALRDNTLTSYLEEIRGDPLYDLIITDMEKWRVMAINNSCDTEYEENSQWEMIMSILKRADIEANYTVTSSGVSLAWEQCSMCLMEHKTLVSATVTLLLLLALFRIIMS